MISTSNAFTSNSTSPNKFSSTQCQSNSGSYSFSKVLLTSLLGISALTPAAARTLFSPRAEFASRALSENGTNHHYLPHPDAVPSIDHENSLQSPFAKGNFSCKADILLFDSPLNSGLVSVKSAGNNCKIAQSVLARVQSIPGCDKLFVAQWQAERQDLSSRSENIKHNYGQVTFDPSQRLCAQSLLKMIVARSVHKDALSIGIPMAICATALLVSGMALWKRFGVSSNDPAQLLSLITPVKHALLVGTQSVVGAAILNRAAQVAGQHNPFAGYDLRDSFMQGAAGSLILGCIPLAAVAAVDGKALIRQDALNAVLTQLAGAVFGTVVLRSMNMSRQGYSEAAQASCAGSFLALAAIPVAETLFTDIPNLLASQVRRRQGPAAVEMQVQQAPSAELSANEVAVALA